MAHFAGPIKHGRDAWKPPEDRAIEAEDPAQGATGFLTVNAWFVRMWGLARKLTLRQRLLALVTAAIVPVAAALVYFIVAIHQAREREVRDMALRTSQIAALEMERIISGAQGILQTLALSPSVRFATSDCDAYLSEVASRLPYLRGFAVADPDGTVRCAAGMDLGPGGLAGEPWFRTAPREDGFAVGEFTGIRPDEAPFLPVALWTDDGSAHVIVTGIDLAWLGARLRERNLARGSALAIADRNGVVIAREPDSEDFVGNRISEQNMFLVRAQQPGTVEVAGPDGVRLIVGYQPPAATGLGLYVGAGFSKKAAFAPVYASTLRSLALAGTGALAACLVAWSVGERLFRQPIHRILSTVASWRAGDDSARTGITADAGELSTLAAAIDEYMDNLAAVRAERAKAEEHRALLLHEMNHRIKNILAAVQAIARQTFKGRATADSLRAFDSRLVAMGATHDLLVSEAWETADLHRTLKAALDPFGREGAQRFVLRGPALRLSARAALALSMALHELCTNASKYGALSTPDGRVSIAWRLESTPEGERFRLTWTETGGPEVAAPTRAGFGSRLIEGALASELGAEAELRFAAGGVEFVLDADADKVVAARAAETAA